MLCLNVEGADFRALPRLWPPRGRFWRLGQAGEGGNVVLGLIWRPLFSPKEMKPIYSDSVQALLTAGSMCALCGVSLHLTFRSWSLREIGVRHSQGALSL